MKDCIHLLTCPFVLFEFSSQLGQLIHLSLIGCIDCVGLIDNLKGHMCKQGLVRVGAMCVIAPVDV